MTYIYRASEKMTGVFTKNLFGFLTVYARRQILGAKTNERRQERRQRRQQRQRERQRKRAQ